MGGQSASPFFAALPRPLSVCSIPDPHTRFEQELLVKDAADKARSAKKTKNAGKGKKRAAMSDDDDDFEIKPKKKAAPIKKAKPAVALPATDDENYALAPVKVSISLAFYPQLGRRDPILGRGR